MGHYATERFILVKESRPQGNEQHVQFLPFFGDSPKEAWERCERIYGELHMHQCQDEGFKAVPFKLSFTV